MSLRRRKRRPWRQSGVNYFKLVTLCGSKPVRQNVIGFQAKE